MLQQPLSHLNETWGHLKLANFKPSNVILFCIFSHILRKCTLLHTTSYKKKFASVLANDSWYMNCKEWNQHLQNLTCLEASNWFLHSTRGSIVKATTQELLAAWGWGRVLPQQAPIHILSWVSVHIPNLSTPPYTYDHKAFESEVKELSFPHEQDSCGSQDSAMHWKIKLQMLMHIYLKISRASLHLKKIVL